jgi:hypothetical protein
MSYGQYVYLLIYFSIDMDALRAIVLKSAFVNRYSKIKFSIIFNHKDTKMKSAFNIFPHKNLSENIVPKGLGKSNSGRTIFSWYRLTKKILATTHKHIGLRKVRHFPFQGKRGWGCLKTQRWNPNLCETLCNEI